MIKMTIKEAIRCIEKHNECHSKSEPFAVYITEALSMSLEALEKQIPKKPEQDEECFLGRVCPRCRGYLGNVQFIPNNYLYCQRCGGAIDWSENNEK